MHACDKTKPYDIAMNLDLDTYTNKAHVIVETISESGIVSPVEINGEFVQQ